MMAVTGLPKRIQRKRTRGWRMPEGAVYVGRPTKWGNPFHTHGDGYPMDRRMSVDLFRTNIQKIGGFFPNGCPGPLTLEDEIRTELRGKDLACWCPLFDSDGNRVPCHADVLLEIANAPMPAGGAR